MNERYYKHIKFVTKVMKMVNNNEPKIKWKGKEMKHWQNWQYATTKEVLAVHEIINPYDWQLDIETNEDFIQWEKEYNNQ